MQNTHKTAPFAAVAVDVVFHQQRGSSFVVLRAGARWSLYDRVSFTDLVYHTPYRPYRCLGWPVTVVVVRVRLCLLQ